MPTATVPLPKTGVASCLLAHQTLIQTLARLATLAGADAISTQLVIIPKGR